MRVSTSSQQMTLELEPGLLARYKTLRECVHHTVLNDPRGMKAVAADCDLSMSELSRRLNPSDDDPRSLDINLFVEIVNSTQDMMPLRWLIARFIPDDNMRRGAALQKLERLLPEIAEALKESKR